MRRIALISIVFAAISPAVAAQDSEKPDPNAKAWDALKSLAGEWVNPADEEDPDKIVLAYRYIAASNVVVETYEPGLPTEEITIYARDNDAITLTHFCSMGSTARMRVDANPTGNAMSFTCAGPTNVDSEDDMHMHQMELTITDADHIQSAWTLHRDSKKAQTFPFDLTRVKE